MILHLSQPCDAIKLADKVGHHRLAHSWVPVAGQPFNVLCVLLSCSDCAGACARCVSQRPHDARQAVLLLAVGLDLHSAAIARQIAQYALARLCHGVEHHQALRLRDKLLQALVDFKR